MFTRPTNLRSDPAATDEATPVAWPEGGTILRGVKIRQLNLFIWCFRIRSVFAPHMTVKLGVRRKLSRWNAQTHQHGRGEYHHHDPPGRQPRPSHGHILRRSRIGQADHYTGPGPKLLPDLVEAPGGILDREDHPRIGGYSRVAEVSGTPEPRSLSRWPDEIPGFRGTGDPCHPEASIIGSGRAEWASGRLRRNRAGGRGGGLRGSRPTGPCRRPGRRVHRGRGGV